MKKKVLVITFAILFSFVILLLKNSFSQSLPRKEYGAQALIKNKQVDSLYVGSSMFKLGIDPNEIGQNDYVLSYNGNEPVNIKEELLYLLKNDVQINSLYVDMYAWTISREPWIDDLSILWDVDLETTNNIYSDIYESNSSLRYKYEYYVSANNDFLISYPFCINILNNYYLKGGKNYYSNGSNKEHLDSLDLPNFSKDDIALNSVQIEAIKEINKICTDNKIKLVFIETPKYSKEANWEPYKYIMFEYASLLSKLGIKYVLAEETGININDANNFIDLIHMSSQGSKEYTNKLVNLLAQ